MTTLTVLTWNTQGSPVNDATKYDDLTGLLDGYNVDVAMLQESGNKDLRVDGFSEISGVGVGAKTERCTNRLICRDSKFKDVNELDGDGLCVVGGGDAGRTPAMAQLKLGSGKMIAFVSWHSISSKSNADTSYLLKGLASWKTKVDTDTVYGALIGGDFNTTPMDMVELVTQSPSLHPMGGMRTRSALFQINHSGYKTQDSGKELDFFVNNLSSKVSASKPFVHNTKSSDHDPVIMTLTIE